MTNIPSGRPTTRRSPSAQRRAGNESDKARLFLYDCATTEMRDLTADFDYNAMNVVWAGNDELRFIAPIEATHQICRVATVDGEVEVLTEGDHDINAFTTGGGRIVAEPCTISSAPEFYEVNPADGTLTQLSGINKAIYENIPHGRSPETLGADHRRQADAHVGDPPARLRPGKEVPDAALLPGRSPERRLKRLELPLELSVDGRPGLHRRGTEPPRPALLRGRSGSTRSRATTRARTSATTSRLSTTWPGTVGRRRRMGCGSLLRRLFGLLPGGCHEKRFKAFIAHCGIFNFESMYGETEWLFFINNDYGGPYWEKETPRRSAPMPTRRTSP